MSGKGKRWRKGQSSSSNPETHTHRLAAKSRFFQENLNPKSNLTSEALEKHDVIMGTQLNSIQYMGEDVYSNETGSIGTFKTFQTFASDWSNCSNVSFNRLLTRFNSQSALHKEMLAVLAAVTEVIKSNGGKETSTEYFGALMTTLQAAETENSIGSILSLLGMGIKTVPENVLKLKFSEVSKVFMDILANFASSSNTVILRQLLGCLSVVLRAQDAGVWSQSSTVVIFDSILSFTINLKPKVRKAAQHAVCAVLKGSNFMAKEDAPLYHPAAVHAAKFCVQQLELGGSLGGSTTKLHMIGLLKEIIGTFPKAQLKQACECILKVMTLGNVLVLSCGMQALHGLFSSRPFATSLPAELNAQIISALFDYQPAHTDQQPTLAWLAVMQEAYINLAGLDLNLWSANLPRFFNIATQLWLTERTEIMSGATLTLEAVMENHMKEISSAIKLKKYEPIVYKIVQSAESGLKYQFHTAWPYVLHLLGKLFENLGETCFKLVKPVIRSLGELRDTDEFTYKNELENAVVQAVKTFGPENVLSAIPLQITGLETNYEFKRSWMLPVLKEGIHGAPLKYFIDYFLPLATICRKQSQSSQDQVAIHSYKLLHSQIWSLLPSFCYNAPDLCESFKGIAKILGTIINEYKDLRIPVMTSLRRLIINNRDNYMEGNVNELRKYAKNYLPILFNVYTTKHKGSDEEGQRLAAFETIQVYLTIASSELAAELFDKAASKLKLDNVEEFTKESMLDLLRVLISYQSVERIEEIYTGIQKAVVDPKDRHQKKSYRLLEEICASSSESCRTFVKNNEESLEDLLIGSLSSCISSTRGPRLRCLIHLVQRMESGKMDTLQKLIPEAILCCKDINVKCRKSAFRLLVLIGQAMLRSSDKSEIEVMEDLVSLIMAGLSGSPSLVSASLLALGTVAYEFRDMLPQDLKKLLLENICLLLASASREIVGTALSYVKAYVVLTPVVFLGPSVPIIMKSLLAMTEDCQRHFRRKVQNILDRLIRKMGYESISGLVPLKNVTMHKRLHNIKKMNERKKKASSQKDEEESDDENDNLFHLRRKPKTIEEILESDSDFEDKPEKERRGSKKKKTSTYILEDADTIVDFTDASAAKKIVASLPSTSRGIVEKKEKKKEPFKTSSDGRLIITNDDESGDEFNQRTNRKYPFNMAEDSDDDLDDLKSRVSSVKAPVNRKRKLTLGSEASEPPSKYIAGGSGIHRPIAKAKRRNQAGKGPQAYTGEVYKANKAKGDIKKKGLPDPYAYVPLSRNMLNRRKKLKHAGKFNNLVGAAKKGARKGKKEKAKKKMRK